MPKPLPVNLTLLPPTDAMGWVVRADASGIPGRGYGIAQDQRLGLAVEKAILVALAYSGDEGEPYAEMAN